jgi:hypothetical protein
MQPYNSGWENFASWSVSPSKLARRGEEVLNHLERRGIRIPPGNRVQRAIEITDQLNSTEALAKATPDQLSTASEAFRTLWEVFFICYTKIERPRQSEAISNEGLAALLRGADTPIGESKSTPRDTQFELLTAAMFILGGADVKPGEPDLRFLYHGRYVGIAAKRVRSLQTATLRDALRDAARQIQGATKVGFVAMNLDTRLQELDTSGASTVGASFNAQVHDAHQQLFDISEKEAILGGLLFGTFFGWNLERAIPRMEFYMPFQIQSFTMTDEDVRRTREFFEPWRARLAASIAEVIPLVSRPAA